MTYVFVGGFGDGPSGHRIVYDYCQSFARTHADVHYFNWDQQREIKPRLGQATTSDKLLLVGHSYGGDTAGNIAAHFNRNIDLLITIDPVGHTTRSTYRQIKANCTTWVDVNARPRGWLNFSNWIAGLGSAWGDDVEGIGTVYIGAV